MTRPAMLDTAEVGEAGSQERQGHDTEIAIERHGDGRRPRCPPVTADGADHRLSEYTERNDSGTCSAGKRPAMQTIHSAEYKVRYGHRDTRREGRKGMPTLPR